jgi:hypothetical protein
VKIAGMFISEEDTWTSASELAQLYKTKDAGYLLFCISYANDVPEQFADDPQFLLGALEMSELGVASPNGAVFGESVKLVALLSHWIIRAGDPDDLHGRLAACLATILAHLEGEFNSEMRRILSIQLHRAFGSAFSVHAMQFLTSGTLTIDEQSIVLFFICRHLTPDLASQMNEIFSAVLSVELSMVAERENTDDCLYSFVHAAFAVFDRDVCFQTFFARSTAMISSGDISQIVVGFHVLSEVLDCAPYQGVVATTELLPVWIPFLLQQNRSSISMCFGILNTLIEKKAMTFRLSWEWIFNELSQHVANPIDSIRLDFWTITERLRLEDVINRSVLVHKLLALHSQIVASDRDMYLIVIAQALEDSVVDLPDACIDDLFQIVTEVINMPQGKFGAATLGLQLWLREPDVFGDIVAPAIDVLISGLLSKDNLHVQTMC